MLDKITGSELGNTNPNGRTAVVVLILKLNLYL